MVMIILGVLFVATIIVAIIVLRKNLGSISGKSSGGAVASISSNPKTSQEFLPFAEIQDGIIDLGNFRYRAVIECSSINFWLKTDEEKNIIEMQFRNFIDGLNYPISFFVQTKELNYANMLSSLKENIEKTLSISSNEEMENYANNYFSNMTNLKDATNITKQKKNYIIVPYEDAVNIAELKGEEKERYAIKETLARATGLVDALKGIGIKGRILDSEETVELFYSMYHRDDSQLATAIGNGEFTMPIVKGEQTETKEDKIKEAILIFQEAENKFKIDILDSEMNHGAYDVFNAMSASIEDLKQQLLDIQKHGGIDTLKTLEEQFNEANKSQSHSQRKD